MPSNLPAESNFGDKIIHIVMKSFMVIRMVGNFKVLLFPNLLKIQGESTTVPVDI